MSYNQGHGGVWMILKLSLVKRSIPWPCDLQKKLCRIQELEEGRWSKRQIQQIRRRPGIIATSRAGNGGLGLISTWQFVLTDSTVSGLWCSNDLRPSPDFSPQLRDKIWEWPGEEGTWRVHAGNKDLSACQQLHNKISCFVTNFPGLFSKLPRDNSQAKLLVEHQGRHDRQLWLVRQISFV